MVQHFLNDILCITSQSTFFFFWQFVWINRRTILNRDMGWFYKWYVILNDVTCVCDRHWNDRTSGLFSDFQTAFFKWCHFIAVSAGAFRENADGNALFDIFDSLQNGFQAGFHVITFQKQAVKSFHPDVQQRHFFQ